VVWHHRRGSICRFWRQQRGYGRAETLLERKWPEKYNWSGHPTWGGRLYGRGAGGRLRRSRIYHGPWGTGTFQPELDEPAGTLTHLAAMPEWYLVIAGLFALGMLGVAWAPLLAALVPAALAAAVTVAYSIGGARRATFAHGDRRKARLRATTFLLFLLQPAARLAGRLRHGLAPWRRPRRRTLAVPAPRHRTLWSETWRAPDDRVRGVERDLHAAGQRVRRGGPTDRWDLQIVGGALGSARLRTAVEEHGRGRQLLRCRVWPRVPAGLPPLAAAIGAVGIAALQGHAWLVGGLLVTVAVALPVAAVCECAMATSAVLRALAAAEAGP
jgi:hypothetical protein